MMKKKIFRIISCIITCCLTIFILCGLTDLLERKSSEQKYYDFFNQEQDFDVLFMGTSHVINAVFPMELWNDYGIVSYNFGGHANQMATTYWVMRNALEKTTPKVIVIDCYSIEGQYKTFEKFSYTHLSLDAFPLSITKIKAIWDLLDDPILEADTKMGKADESDEPRTKIGLLWDYSLYHYRWSEIFKDDFVPVVLHEKGAESRIGVVRGELNRISPDDKLAPGTTGDIYLRKAIEECQSRGIDVLLTYIPFPALEEDQRTANYIYDVAREYGVNYINFLDENLIDFQTDLVDEVSHLNPSGARKVTNYLGEYLANHYSVPDRRNDSVYSRWDIDYEEYVSLKDDNIKKSEDVYDYLMMLSGDDVQIAMDIRNKDIFKNAWADNLLANIGVDITQINDDTDFILVGNRGASAVVLDNYIEDGKSISTELGEVSIYRDTEGIHHDGEKGYFGLYLNGEENLIGNINDDTSLQINVFRNNELVDSVRFIYYVNPETLDLTTIAINR